MSNLTLGELIAFLENQDPVKQVDSGFSTSHCDRGNYADLAFTPEERTTLGSMLAHAKAALDQEFTGYKGGEYKMHEYSYVLIGEYGECGENITSTHLKYWLLD